MNDMDIRWMLRPFCWIFKHAEGVARWYPKTKHYAEVMSHCVRCGGLMSYRREPEWPKSL